MFSSYSKVANGNISPCRFVKLDATAEGRVLQAGAGESAYGISQAQNHNIALSGAGFTQTDDGFAAIAGEMLNIWGPGDPNVMLECGATVTVGDALKSDASGRGITGSADKDIIGAIALASGTVGKFILVEFRRYDRSI